MHSLYCVVHLYGSKVAVLEGSAFLVRVILSTVVAPRLA